MCCFPDNCGIRVIIPLPRSNCLGVWQRQALHSFSIYYVSYTSFIFLVMMYYVVYIFPVCFFTFVQLWHRGDHSAREQLSGCLAEARNRYAGNRSFGVLCTDTFTQMLYTDTFATNTFTQMLFKTNLMHRYIYTSVMHRYIHTNVISNNFNAPIYSQKCYAPIRSCVLSKNFNQKPQIEQACKIKFKATNSVEIMDLHQPYQDCPLQCLLFALLSAYISR